MNAVVLALGRAPQLALLGFDLLRPAHSAWIAAGLGFLALGIWSLRRRKRERERLVAARHASRFLPGFAPGLATARVVLAALALCFLAFAVTGPVRGYTEKSVARKGLDLVVCIDTSRSMLVRDLRPDRLTRAKREVAGLIERMKGDRLALVAFAGEARDVAPLTHDRTTLRALLERVTTEENTKGGTDLGVALSHALESFDGQAAAYEAVVILTDGEDLEGRGLEVARTAAERGVRVYIVGMATEGGGKIPQAAGDGRESFVVDETGREVISTLNEASLVEIAKLTGGEYIAAAKSAVPLEELYLRRINRLEGRELEGGIEYVPHDRFQWFLAVALACMIVEGALRERRRSARQEGVA
ncbi:MAG: VWA domain-containing protein [Planctomycetes bacterium]|nr:VWA domain-containing protein [Planctomycetota bacterium]